MSLKTILSSIALAITVSACSTTPSPVVTPPSYTGVDTQDILVCRVPLDIQRPVAPEWNDFQWQVINDEIVEEMREKDTPIRFYALSHSDFMNFSLTMQDIVRYIRTQDTVIEELQKYYSPNNYDGIDKNETP